MNVLSVFGGIEAGRLALIRAGIEVNNYYSSEVDKFANQVTKHHFPEINQMGDVTKWREWGIDWSSIDLFIGGSPCQGFSFAGKQAGTKAVVNGEEVIVETLEQYLELCERKKAGESIEFLSQSYLFWEYVAILKHIQSYNPKVKFLLENVKMKKELLQMIDDALGVTSVVINSALLSAQNRVRHYWANWEITQPEDKGILLRDILEGDAIGADIVINQGRSARRSNIDKSHCLMARDYKGFGNQDITGVKIANHRPCERIKDGSAGHIANATDIKGMDCIKRVYGQDGKAPTLTTMGGGHREPKVSCGEVTYRKLTPTECARLQTFPDGFCESIVSNSQSYKAYGNSWTVDVIAHIFRCMP